MGLNQIQPHSLISRQLYSLLFLFQEFLGIFWEPLKGLIASSVAKHPAWSETQEQTVTARGAGILGGHVRSPSPSWLCGQSVAWVRGLRLPGRGDRSKRPGAWTEERDRGLWIDGDNIKQRCLTWDTEGEEPSSQKTRVPRGLWLRCDTGLQGTGEACVCSSVSPLNRDSRSAASWGGPSTRQG